MPRVGYRPESAGDAGHEWTERHGLALERRLGRSEGLERASDPASPEVETPDGEPQGLWQALGHDPTDMDQLVSRTGLTAATLSSMLLAMELQGRVSVEHGRYSRKR